MLSIVDETKLRRILARMLDEAEFFGPHGIRALSRFHLEHPYVFHHDGQEHRVAYVPGDSDTGMFGGNSNWRGPVWMPINFLLYTALLRLYAYYGDDFKVECPTGSGQMMTLLEVAQELGERLSRIFLRDASGSAPGRWRGAQVRATIRTGATWCCSTNTSTATPAPASAPATRPAGPDAWPRSSRPMPCSRRNCCWRRAPRSRLYRADSFAKRPPKSDARQCGSMKSYYADMNLPEPVVPAVQALTLLKGQTALVTGANSGIGRAIAISLGKARRRRGRQLRGQARGSRERRRGNPRGGRRAMTAQADVADEAQVQAMFAAAVREFGTVDILVSNAGMERNAPFHEMTTAQWDAVMNVNLRGAFLCAREAVREFLRRGVRPEVSVAAGKIIFTSSVHEVIPWAGHVNYAASKGGLMLLMKSLAQEVAEKRIRVELHRARRDPHAHQRGRLGHARGLRRAHEARAVQAHRRSRGDRPCRGLAGLGLHRLPGRHHAVHRRWHDAVSRVRDRRLSGRPGRILIWRG